MVIEKSRDLCLRPLERISIAIHARSYGEYSRPGAAANRDRCQPGTRLSPRQSGMTPETGEQAGANPHEFSFRVT